MPSDLVVTFILELVQDFKISSTIILGSQIIYDIDIMTMGIRIYNPYIALDKDFEVDIGHIYLLVNSTYGNLPPENEARFERLFELLSI